MELLKLRMEIVERIRKLENVYKSTFQHYKEGIECEIAGLQWVVDQIDEKIGD